MLYMGVRLRVTIEHDLDDTQQEVLPSFEAATAAPAVNSTPPLRSVMRHFSRVSPRPASLPTAMEAAEFVSRKRDRTVRFSLPAPISDAELRHGSQTPGLSDSLGIMLLFPEAFADFDALGALRDHEDGRESRSKRSALTK